MKKGMAAIITVIILGAVMVLIGTVMTLTSISEGQATVMETKVKKNQAILDACVEESLLIINENDTLPSIIVTTLGSCVITINSHINTNWNFNLKISGEMSSLNINIVLNRGSIITISNWIDQ